MPKAHRKKLTSLAPSPTPTRELITFLFNALLTRILDTLPDQEPETILTATKQTQTNPPENTSASPHPSDIVHHLRAEKDQIRELLAKHFINLHSCSPSKRCTTINQLRHFWADTKPRITPRGKCYKGQNSKLIPSTIERCPICNVTINQTNINHLIQCIEANPQSLICIFCEVQIKPGEIKSHLSSHSYMLQNLRGPHSAEIQDQCKNIAVRSLTLINVSINKNRLGDLMNEWLHATFCSTHCVACNSVSSTLNQLSQHTLEASVNTDHYCIGMPIYHYILRGHIIACEDALSCPLPECQADPFSFIPELVPNIE